MPDIIEIQQLMALYGHAVDASDQALLPLVFTEDAVFDAQASGYGLIEGRAAIAVWFALGKPPHPPSHHATNVHVYEADGQTRVRSKWLFADRRTGGIVTGDYDDVVIRTVDGWRINRRSFRYSYPEPAERQSPAPVGGEAAPPMQDPGSGRVNLVAE